MKLIDAFDFSASFHPAWKDGGSGWTETFRINRGHILDILGANLNVNKIDKVKLAAFRAQLMLAPGHKGRRQPATVNRIMALLNSVLKDLEENEVIAKQPKLKPLKENGAREEYYTKEQLEKMLFTAVDVFDDHELRDALKLAVFTGCRQSELLKLEVGDVDLTRMMVTFRNTKNGTTHTLDLHPQLKEMLAIRCENEPSDAKVFTGFSNRDNLYYRFCKVREYLGYSKKLVWHSLRHTTGTWLAENGCDVLTIARVLNHKSTATTARYVKLTDKARKTAINSL